MCRDTTVDDGVKCAIGCFTKYLLLRLGNFHPPSFRIHVAIVVLVVLREAFYDANDFIASLTIVSFLLFGAARLLAFNQDIEVAS